MTRQISILVTMRPSLILIVFLVLASFFTGTAFPARAQNKPQAESENIVPKSDFKDLRETDSSTVIDVIDPLTIKLENGDTVTLTGLDYPDLDYYSPGNFSLLATKILKDMLVGKEVILYQTIGKTGLENRMGHRIAHVERANDGLWVQGTMLSLGLARVRTTPNNAHLADQMLALEKQAREEKIGLWDVIVYTIHDAQTADHYIGSYQIIEGTIKNVGLKEGRIYINFGDNWREDFTASITPTNKRAFAKAGFNFQNMGGQNVRVRGWISSYNGAYMEITHPAQIEMLATSSKVQLKTSPELEKKGSGLEKGDALPEVELNNNAEEQQKEIAPDKKTKKSVTLGDPSILKRTTSMNE